MGLVTGVQKMFWIIFLLLIKDSHCCEEIRTVARAELDNLDHHQK